MSTISRSPATLADVNAEGSRRRWLALPLAAFLSYWLLLRAISSAPRMTAVRSQFC